jgi:hypothetical protein
MITAAITTPKIGATSFNVSDIDIGVGEGVGRVSVFMLL